jgi:hypothetical protein
LSTFRSPPVDEENSLEVKDPSGKPV